jgi:hypothetical protein
LGELELARLAWLAELEGTSQAEIIRRAIGAYAPRTAGEREFRVIRSGTGSGGSIADLGDERLLEGFGD